MSAEPDAIDAIGPIATVETVVGPDELTAPEEERHLRAVPPRRRRQPRVGLWFGTIATAVTLFLLVAFNVFMVQGQFELDTIAKQRANEQRQYELNRVKVARLSSPETIVQKARAMGMVDAPTVTWLNAPKAAPPGHGRDRTSTTLANNYPETKAALDAGP
jgi:hypothetical protein